MTEPTHSEQLAWAAGLFEGEGCFNTHQRRMKWSVQARLAMTDKDVIRRFAAIMGLGQVHGPRHTKGQPDWKPVFEWYVQAAPDVLKVIDLLSPWLGARRSAKAAEVREIAATIGPDHGLQTHCRRDHLYEGDNLVIEVRADGGEARRCKACRNEQSRNRARRRLGIPPERWRV
jgi:hypothetical protein